MQNVMKMLTPNDFQMCFRSWKSRWNYCINTKGNYFKGYGANRNFIQWLKTAQEFQELLGITTYTLFTLYLIIHSILIMVFIQVLL